jgi:bacteriorhodopsin
MDLVMIASGFAGAVSSGLNATWPLFTFGCVALVPILYMLVTGFSGRAGQGAPGVKSAFNTLMGLTLFVWCGYPIIVSVLLPARGRRGSAGWVVTWGAWTPAGTTR